MSIVLDLLLVIIVVATILLGARRGFVKAIIGLVGVVLAIVLMRSFAAPLASVLDDSVVRPWAVEQAMQAQGVTAQTPTDSLDLARVDTALADYLNINITGVEETPPTVGEYMDAIFLVNGITLAVSKAMAAIAIFIVSSLGLKLLSLLLKPILKLPVLRQCNGVLGAVIGAANAVMLVLILATVVYLLIETSSTPALDEQTVEQTLLFRHVYHNNPILGWITK